MWVDLSDGRTLGVPLAWFPRILRATPDQREQLRISTRGLHWEALDEDISIAALLTSQADEARDKNLRRLKRRVAYLFTITIEGAHICGLRKDARIKSLRQL